MSLGINKVSSDSKAEGTHRHIGASDSKAEGTHRHIGASAHKGVGHGVYELAAHTKVTQLDLSAGVH